MGGGGASGRGGRGRSEGWQKGARLVGRGAEMHQDVEGERAQQYDDDLLSDPVDGAG